jgi:hypothetical protein
MYALQENKAQALALHCIYKGVPISLIHKDIPIMDEAYLMGREDASSRLFGNRTHKLLSSHIGYLEDVCEKSSISEKYIEAVVRVADVAYLFGIADGTFRFPRNNRPYVIDLQYIVQMANPYSIPLASKARQ